MIITFSTTTEDTRNGEKTYWFNVRLPGYEWTALDIGFDKNGNFISASGPVFQLEKSIRDEIIQATAPMVAKLV